MRRSNYVIGLSLLSALILTGFNMIYGLAYYVIPTVLYTIVIISYIIEHGKIEVHAVEVNRLLYGDPTKYIVLFTFIVWYLSEFILGFGLNIAVVTPFQYLVYSIYYLSLFTAIEVIRRKLLNHFSETRIRYTHLIIVSLITWSILFMIQYEGFRSTTLVLQASILYLQQLLLTIIAWRYGFRSQLMLTLTYAFLLKISPILIVLSPEIMVMFTGLIVLSQTAIWYFYEVRSASELVKNKVFFKETNIFEKISTIVNVVIAIILVIALIGFLSGYRALAVVSGSMNPTMNRGDLVVIDINDKNVTKGDITAFIVYDKVVVHRVVNTYVLNDEKIYVTKGDANDDVDPWIIRDENLVGKYVATIPYIGYITLTYTQLFPNKILGIAVISLFILYPTIFYLIKKVVLLIG